MSVLEISPPFSWMEPREREDQRLVAVVVFASRGKNGKSLRFVYLVRGEGAATGYIERGPI